MVRAKTYLTDFMVLSSLLAGLLPGDSFLLRRNARRFFISLALGDKAIDRQRERERERERQTERRGDRRRRLKKMERKKEEAKREGWRERQRERERDGLGMGTGRLFGKEHMN